MNIAEVAVRLVELNDEIQERRQRDDEIGRLTFGKAVMLELWPLADEADRNTTLYRLIRATLKSVYMDLFGLDDEHAEKGLIGRGYL